MYPVDMCICNAPNFRPAVCIRSTYVDDEKIILFVTIYTLNSACRTSICSFVVLDDGLYLQGHLLETTLAAPSFWSCSVTNSVLSESFFMSSWLNMPSFELRGVHFTDYNYRDSNTDWERQVQSNMHLLFRFLAVYATVNSYYVRKTTSEPNDDASAQNLAPWVQLEWKFSFNLGEKGKYFAT